MGAAESKGGRLEENSVDCCQVRARVYLKVSKCSCPKWAQVAIVI